MHILGVGGMMRRIYNPLQYDFLQTLQPINVFITISAFALGAAQIVLVNQFLLESLCWEAGGGEPMAGEHPGVECSLTAPPRQLGRGPSNRLSKRL